MAENHFDVADSLISKADALGVEYGIWYTGDTPRKARRDLERKRNAALAEPIKPSQLLTPDWAGRRQEGPRRPIRSRDMRPSRPATSN